MWSGEVLSELGGFCCRNNTFPPIKTARIQARGALYFHFLLGCCLGVPSVLCFLFRGSLRSTPGAEVAANCTPCPGGHHCPELGTVTPRACGVGNFSVRSNAFFLSSLQHKAGIWQEGSSQGRLRLGMPRGRHRDELTSFLRIWDGCEQSFKHPRPPVLALGGVKLLFQRLGMFLQQVWNCSR